MGGISPQLDPLLHPDCAIHPSSHSTVRTYFLSSYPLPFSLVYNGGCVHFPSLQYWVRGSAESPNPIRKKPKVGPDKQINAINRGLYVVALCLEAEPISWVSRSVSSKGWELRAESGKQERNLILDLRVCTPAYQSEPSLSWRCPTSCSALSSVAMLKHETPTVINISPELQLRPS